MVGLASNFDICGILHSDLLTICLLVFLPDAGYFRVRIFL
jgi:hypothetical protein